MNDNHQTTGGSAIPCTRLRRTRRATCGYTLIELMMVMSIIAILSTMAFFLFGMIQARANKTSTKALLGRIGKAIELYANDFGDPPLFQAAGFLAGDWNQVQANNTMLYTILCTKSDSGVYQGGRRRAWPGYLTGNNDLGTAADHATESIRDLWGQPLIYVARRDWNGVSTTNWGWPTSFAPFDSRKFLYELWSAGKDGEFSTVRGNAVAATTANVAAIDNDNIPSDVYDPSDLRYQ